MSEHKPRRLLALLLCLALVFSVVPRAAAEDSPPAAELPEDSSLQETVFYPDGSREVTVTHILSAEPGRGSVTASKDRKYYSDSNVLLWKVTLTGTFSYNGSSSSCTAASTAVNIYSSTWVKVSEYTNHSGSTATCAVMMGKKVLGVVITFINVNLTLSCDKNGNIS